MITPTSGSITVTTEPKTYDGIWINSINIQAPNCVIPIKAMITISPFNSSTGEICNSKRKTIMIDDIEQLAQSSSYVALAMQNIYSYVQDLVVSKSLF